MIVTPIVLAGHECLACLPDEARWLLVLGHGAGAGMRHRFMVELAAALAACGVATLRYQLPYMAAGRKRPDSPKVATAAIAEITAAAAREYKSLRLAVGGKSFGGRMTTVAQAAGLLPEAEAIVLLGFPLHPAGAPAITRAAHLCEVTAPMLFVQGTRDALATPSLLAPVLATLGPSATLRQIAAADHGFDVLVRSGRKPADVLAELASVVAAWLAQVPIALGPTA